MSLRIKLLKAQQKFLESKTRGTIYRGGIGSGKTRIICYSAILGALKKRRSVIVSFSYPMLRDVVLSTLVSSLPLFGLEQGRDYLINKSEMIVSIAGTEILLRSGDKPDSLRGLNVSDFYIDEAREFKNDSIFLILLGRIRESKDSRWYIVSSPHGNDWVNQLTQSGGNVNLIVQKTADNVFLPYGYINELRSRYTSVFAAQELDAEIIEYRGDIINVAWFNVIPYVKPSNGVRAWDVAVSVKTHSDFSVGALCSYNIVGDGIFCIHNIIRVKCEYPDLRKKIVESAQLDGTDIQICIEDAGQQRGFIDDIKRVSEIKAHTIRAKKPTGDKLNRANSWAARAELGQVYVCKAAWNSEFFDECSSFTADMSHQHDDQIDAVSMAYECLVRPSKVVAKNIRY